MAKSKDAYTVIPVDVEEKEMEEKQPATDKTDQAEDELEERFDKEFWLMVQNKVKDANLSWNRALDEVRVDRLIKKHDKNALLVIIHKWPQKKKYKDKPELIPSLEYLISRLTEIILERDTKEDYKYFRVPADTDRTRTTLLHLAAEQNFLHVTKSLVECYPGLMYMWTRKQDDNPSCLPVELALKKYKDDTAAYLISQMRHDRIHRLFLCEDDEEQTTAKFFFGHYISYQNPRTNEPGMKKTVIAVLDKLINPHCPYLPHGQEGDEYEDEIERSLSSVPDDPMNYDFFYHILEADESGRQPKIKVATEVGDQGAPISTETVSNLKFNHKSPSCLRQIAESGNRAAVQHPVVRIVQGSFYIVFLTLLSFALIYGSTLDDPTQYGGRANGLRLFCEVLTIIFLMFYFFEEVNQAEREWRTYFKDPYNYFDWLGLILTLLVIPLRFAKVRYQWSVAALGYLFNFLRLFKFSCVTRTTGLYTKTLAKIIYRDITRFSVVFVIVCLGFCGAMFMALKATGSQELFSNYAWLMLAAVRALAEQQPVEEDYSKFSWLSILILVAYMAMVIVILLNILIAQLSYTYSEAKKTAKLQYAIDTMFIVTRLEYSRHLRWNLRVKNYLDGDWISEEDLAKELLEYTDDRHPFETMEERLTDIREIMRKVFRKGKDKEA
ncbi:Transient receptor potential cation channel subfamily V member 4 [Stylophora pistillata]|uniref:Transient receptor potential cation channel subfamily V member 4 n=1 Tax=Stylophora pistillata TaxID=50429 RepID=A0A2B4SN80_STYPI|nr:Transient receptor potential cation channel subfamily V member 4 [Stylophora pistillata]